AGAHERFSRVAPRDAVLHRTHQALEPLRDERRDSDAKQSAQDRQAYETHLVGGAADGSMPVNDDRNLTAQQQADEPKQRAEDDSQSDVHVVAVMSSGERNSTQSE